MSQQAVSTTNVVGNHNSTSSNNVHPLAQSSQLVVPTLLAPVPAPKKAGLRVFLSGANSLLGHALFDELRNDHIAIQPDAEEMEHKFFVSLNQRDAQSIPVPSPPTMRVVNFRTKPKMFKKKISTCDLFILDMLQASLNGSLDEVEQVIKTVKESAAADANRE